MIDLVDPIDPFEIDTQLAHLCKHGPLTVDDIYDVWESDPLFYPAYPPADWLMVAEVPGGEVLCVPLVATSSWKKLRPIGVYRASQKLVTRYLDDR